ncbi:hypothetical protein [Streptomyces anulatus]|uniref:hypothetical protein n=1 Tax=Streptomyces anulatus TaxID=1892 RepID=UPI00344215C4
MSPRQASPRTSTGWTQAETDVAEVMIWLQSNHGREVSYADIAAGIGIKNGHRLRRAVRIARTEFDTMAKAADECLTKISGIDNIGPQVGRRENTSLLTEMIAGLEARLGEPATSQDGRSRSDQAHPARACFLDQRT